MNRAFPNDEMLGNLPPSSLKGYLASRGWRRAGAWRSGATIWLSGDEKAEVLVPDHSDFADYPQRVADLVSRLAETEARPALEVFRDLLLAPFDLARVRADGEEFVEGSLPLAAGVALVQRAQQLMLSAACSAQAPRSNFLRTPKRAEELMGRVRMGQTEQGSYVVTLLVPMPLPPGARLPAQLEMFAQSRVAESEPVPEPFERLVTRRLVDGMGALAEAVSATEKEKSLEPFVRGVPRGLSANLCEAVLGAHEVAHAKVLAVAVHWASVGHAIALEPAATTITLPFEAQTVAVLREGRDLLRARTEPEPDVEVRGHVVKLEKAHDELEGRVTVFGMAGNRQRQVSMTLPLASYNQMVQAHEADAAVSVTGTLEKQGQRYLLKAPRDARQIDLLEED